MNIFEWFFSRVDGLYVCASQHKCFWNPITKLIVETAQQFLQMRGVGGNLSCFLFLQYGRIFQTLVSNCSSKINMFGIKNIPQGFFWYVEPSAPIFFHSFLLNFEKLQQFISGIKVQTVNYLTIIFWIFKNSKEHPTLHEQNLIFRKKNHPSLFFYYKGQQGEGGNLCCYLCLLCWQMSAIGGNPELVDQLILQNLYMF